MTRMKIILIFHYVLLEQSIVLESMGVTGSTPVVETVIATSTIATSTTERSLDGNGFNTSVVSCPYVSYCIYDYSEPLTDSNDTLNRPCCTRCDNTEKPAMVCCPDIIPCTLPAASPGVEEEKVCIVLVFDRKFHEPGVLAIATCRENSDKKERDMCLQEYTYSNVNTSDVVPVTDILSFEVYRNIHCALCNGVNTTNIKNWSVNVICSKTGNIYLAQYSDLIKFLNQESECAIMYENPFQETTVKRCDTTIVSCNVSERVTESMYTKSMEKLCVNRQLSYDSYSNMTFKNPDCLKCNGAYMGSYTKLIPEFPAFSTVLALASSPEIDIHTSSTCPPNMVFFPVKVSVVGTSAIQKPIFLHTIYFSDLIIPQS